MLAYPWGHTGRYNDFQSHFRESFGGEKVQKISVGGAFTCPNRDGTRGTGGCTYCNDDAFNPSSGWNNLPVRDQLVRGIRFFSHKYQGMKYLAYFQSFSNTYASLHRLRDLYEEALSCPGVVGLVIATRPDCLDEPVLDYLAEMAGRVYLMLELGIESHLDRSLQRINRGHSFAESQKAVESAHQRGIRTTAHMILGLPGEGRKDWLEQARILGEMPVDNLKLHQLQIHRDTEMARQYARDPGQFTLFSETEYAGLVVDYLERLNPRITVERFTSQAPPDMVIAPAWGLKNHEFTARVNMLLNERKTWQGKVFQNP